MKGRKPTPTAIKKLNGNPGKRALNKAEPQYADLGLTPPEFLDEIAQKEWRRLIRLMAPVGSIKASDAAVLSAYCSAFSDFVRLAEMGRGKGFIAKAPNGCPMVSPLFTALSKARTEMARLASALGLDPTSRTRVAVEKPEEADELDDFV